LVSIPEFSKKFMMVILEVMTSKLQIMIILKILMKYKFRMIKAVNSVKVQGDFIKK
jgi:hypothetical protein